MNIKCGCQSEYDCNCTETEETTQSVNPASEKPECDCCIDKEVKMGKKDDLKKRVGQFQMLKLPGQPMSVHMGTSYLVDDLWEEVKRLRAEQVHTADACCDSP